MASRFPTSAGIADVTTVVNYARGVPGTTRKQAIEAVWWCTGYGLSFLPDSPSPMGAMAECSDDDCADKIEAAMPKSAGATTMSAAEVKALPWAILLPIFMQLLERWLKK